MVTGKCGSLSGTWDFNFLYKTIFRRTMNIIKLVLSGMVLLATILSLSYFLILLVITTWPIAPVIVSLIVAWGLVYQSFSFLWRYFNKVK